MLARLVLRRRFPSLRPNVGRLFDGTSRARKPSKLSEVTKPSAASSDNASSTCDGSNPLRRGVLHQRAATRKGTDRNPALKPVESPREDDRSLVDEFARVIGDRTILVHSRSDEIFLGEQILRFPIQADRRRYLIGEGSESFVI